MIRGCGPVRSVLMEGQSTKITATKTSAITGKTESDLLNRRNATFFLIHRMIGPHKRKMIHIIHLLLCQWICRWILHHIALIAIIFYQNLRLIRIRILMLDPEASCILVLSSLLSLRKKEDTAVPVYVPHFYSGIPFPG